MQLFLLGQNTDIPLIQLSNSVSAEWQNQYSKCLNRKALNDFNNLSFQNLNSKENESDFS